MVAEAKVNNFFVASTYRRSFAYTIDQVLIVLCYLPFWDVFFGALTSPSAYNISLNLFLFFLVLPAIYELIFLALFSQTPGKKLLGMWVLSAKNCQALDPMQIVKRAVFGRLSLIFSLAPQAAMFFRYDRRHWVDLLAGTIVVQEVPRAEKPKMRWVLGLFLVFMHFSEGIEKVLYFTDRISWQDWSIDIQQSTTDEVDSGWIDFEEEIEE